MLFLTESDLKVKFRESPFTNFCLKPDTRLTPEARQFLIDRNITIQQSSKEEPKEELAKTTTVAPRLLLSLKKTSAQLLLSFSMLLESNTLLAEQVMNWYDYFLASETLLQTGEDTAAYESIKNSEAELTFNISPFHVQLPNGRELAILNWLQICLLELEAVIEEFEIPEEELCEGLKTGVKQINQLVVVTMTQLVRNEQR